jgi:hypothetical protein
MSQFHYSGCLTTAPTFSAICDYLHRQNKVQHSFLSCALIFFFLIFLGLWIKSLSLTLIVLLTAALNFVRSRPSTVLISLLFTYCIWPSQGSLLFPKAKPRLSFFFDALIPTMDILFDQCTQFHVSHEIYKFSSIQLT